MMHDRYRRIERYYSDLPARLISQLDKEPNSKRETANPGQSSSFTLTLKTFNKPSRIIRFVLHLRRFVRMNKPRDPSKTFVEIVNNLAKPKGRDCN